jgi:hypothetical protein
MPEQFYQPQICQMTLLAKQKMPSKLAPLAIEEETIIIYSSVTMCNPTTFPQNF